MRIVTICNLPPPFGGAEVFAKELALRFSQEGEEVSIITQKHFEIQLMDNLEILQYPYLPEQQLDVARQRIKVYPLFVSSIREKFMEKDVEIIDERLVQELKDIFFQEKPDLVHCHFTTGKIKEALSVCREMGLSLVVTLHGMTNLVPMYDSYTCGGLTSEKVFSLLRLCTQIIVVSKETLEYCRDKGLSNVCRIPTGIDTDYFSFTDHMQRKDILYVGKLNGHKGLQETLQAYLKIESVIKEDLYLVGRGINIETFNKTDFLLSLDKKDKVEELIKKGRIYLLGELDRPDLRELYRKSKVLVLPSLTEGFPLVVLEALSCGMPVIASDVGAISDVIQNGRNGYLITKGDSDELAEAIVKMLKNYHFGLQRVCRDSADEYEINKVARDYINLFHDVLNI